jgi:hypothetical protein
MKKSKTRKSAFRRPKLLPTRGYWIALGITLLVAAGVINYYILVCLNRKINFFSEIQTVRSMQAEYNQPNVDTANNRVLLPGARLSLPLNFTTEKLRYQNHFAADLIGDQYGLPAGFGPTITTTDLMVNAYSFEQLNCSFMISFAFVDDIEIGQQHQFFEKKLADGRSVYLHQTTDPCELSFPEVQQKLIDAAKQVESY